MARAARPGRRAASRGPGRSPPALRARYRRARAARLSRSARPGWPDRAASADHRRGDGREGGAHLGYDAQRHQQDARDRGNVAAHDAGEVHQPHVLRVRGVRERAEEGGQAAHDAVGYQPPAQLARGRIASLGRDDPRDVADGLHSRRPISSPALISSLSRVSASSTRPMAAAPTAAPTWA